MEARDGGPSDLTLQQLDYIRMLEKRNKVKQRMEASSSIKENETEERERGFNTHWSGANRDRAHKSTGDTTRFCFGLDQLELTFSTRNCFFCIQAI